MEEKDIVKKFGELEKRIEKLESIVLTKGISLGSSSKKISIREFILLKKPKNDVQRTLCIGYYFEVYEKYNMFNSKDLEEGYRLAKERIPKNINNKVDMNISKDHIMEAKEKKDNRVAWILTNTGVKFIETDFQKDK